LYCPLSIQTVTTPALVKVRVMGCGPAKLHGKLPTGTVVLGRRFLALLVVWLLGARLTTVTGVVRGGKLEVGEARHGAFGWLVGGATMIVP
jgi:hypothetical protein